ncbi:MAG TPA: IS607 family transposase [Cyanobacteria bacterium UBA11162]|nr:IS607 family transposase [Cyanobacteria bacterium UBA11162]HBS70285.1 IS607 family transposase [Cyanobacteria bacterium UBA11153]HCA97627.1 IS607 family transposase [Cyanobacteria bacterium UBA9226]
MYLTPQQVKDKYGYHPKTLAEWADQGKIQCIKSPGGHRRYLASSLDALAQPLNKTVNYARVSTPGQKADLKVQIDYLGSRYPGCETISDVGSGLNFKRKKFLQLMERILKREITTIVVAHKDRLVRFGFDFVEWFCNQHGCEIVVLNHTYKSPHAELMDDFMAIMHCFSSKLYFLRRYAKEIKKDIDKTEGIKHSNSNQTDDE